MRKPNRTGRPASPKAGPKTSERVMRLDKGFTLIELLVAIVVVAILASIAIPGYQQHIRNSRRATAQADLLGFANAMERYYTQNNTYLGAAAGGADTGAPTVYSAASPVDGGRPIYALTIQAATATSYTLQAMPIDPAQTGDGPMQLDSTGAKRWDRNDDGAFDVPDDSCWERSCN